MRVGARHRGRPASPRGDGRVPPQNLEAEESVIGAMMLSAEAIADVVEILQPEDFYRGANARIYEALRGIYARGEPVDLITAVEALKRQGIARRGRRRALPARPGGSGAHAGLGRPLRAHRVADGAAAPADQRRRRRHGDGVLRARGSRARRRRGRAADLRRRAPRGQGRGRRSCADLVDQAMLDLESIQNRDSAYTGLPSGFHDLDDLMSGLQPGNLVIIAARPGIGKSSLATNMARNVAVDGHPVALFSLEMSRFEIGMRLLCAEARVPWDRIRNKRVGPTDWTQRRACRRGAARRAAAHRRLGQRQHRRHPREGAADAHRPQGLDLIIVDYLQLMTSPQHAPPRQPSAGGRGDQPLAEAPGQGAAHPGDRPVAAEPQPGVARRQASAALGPA